jgi:dolichyl-phosphate-mannose-protein mannosyltransferase
MIAYLLAIVCGIALTAILAAAMFVAIRPLWRERRRDLRILLPILATMTLVKLLMLPLFQGYPNDTFHFLVWGEVMTRGGPSAIYLPQFDCRYLPGYLYVLWAAVAPARVLHFGREITDASTSALRVLVRVPPSLADVALALVIFAWLRTIAGARRGLGAVMMFALNPALLYTSVVWGQNDSVLTLPLALALLLAWQGEFAMASAAAALALMVKLQGLIFLPILGLWILLRGRPRDWILSAAAFFAIIIVAFAPFQIGKPWDYLATVMAGSAEYFPYTSMNAFNLPALLFGLRVRDSVTLFGISAFDLGLFLLSALYPVALLIVWRGRTARTLLYAAFLAYLGFFVLPTRIHERYLYFTLALLTPMALDSWATLSMYAALTITFLINQHLTLRFISSLATVAQHDPYASPIACVNIAALTVAIVYGLFLISEDSPRWPASLRGFFAPFAA